MACPGGENRWSGREAIFKMAMTENALDLKS